MYVCMYVCIVPAAAAAPASSRQPAPSRQPTRPHPTMVQRSLRPHPTSHQQTGPACRRASAWVFRTNIPVAVGRFGCWEGLGSG